MQRTSLVSHSSPVVTNCRSEGKFGVLAALSGERLWYGMRGPLTVARVLVETEAGRTEQLVADAARLSMRAAYFRTAIRALPGHWLRARIGLASCYVVDFEDFTICRHGV